VVANNAKLYVNRKEGFIGTALKKDEFVCECSDMADVIVFRKDGKFVVKRIADKVFMGKDILHVAVWKKGDERTTYNMLYADAGSGKTFAKRFQVVGVTRAKEYDLTQGAKGSRVLYLTANPNGESELVTVYLSPGCRAKKKIFDFDFGSLAIKGRTSRGNMLTKYPVRKVVQKERGQSTLGAMELWMDEVSGRINTDGRGRLLGAFDTGDRLLIIYKDGSYELQEFRAKRQYNPKEIMYIGKFDPERIINAVYYEGGKGWTVVKRFLVETTTLGQRFTFITEHPQSKLLFVSLSANPKISYSMRVKGRKMEGQLSLADFVDVKGWKAVGNKLSDKRLSSVQEVVEEEKTANDKKGKKVLKPGDTLEFDL